ncbi:MAG: hypothetical protein LBC67_03585 [Spirochaetales bacterium]|jgi:hypothetical protein|nr:hypothetical protein [Spirochaetales bacterium]
MAGNSFITTTVYKKEQTFAEKRRKLFREAISFTAGTLEKPHKHLISVISGAQEAYFLKPGKETLRKHPNMHDMLPVVGTQTVNYTEKWTFAHMWEYLLKISLIQQEAFKKLLTLLYRICYLMDHREDENGKIRYSPPEEISEYILNVERYVLKAGFAEKFKTTEIELSGFLYFTDLLAWNEDVKYHQTPSGGDDFTDSRRTAVGRVNTVKSIISAPLLISEFIADVIDKTMTKGVINVKLITQAVQRFSQTRGLCVLSNTDLLKHLSPYLEAGA